MIIVDTAAVLTREQPNRMKVAVYASPRAVAASPVAVLCYARAWNGRERVIASSSLAREGSDGLGELEGII